MPGLIKKNLNALKRGLPRNELRVIAIATIFLAFVVVFVKFLPSFIGGPWLNNTLIDEFTIIALAGTSLLLLRTHARLEQAAKQLESHQRLKDELAVVRDPLDLLTALSHAHTPSLPLAGLALLLPDRVSGEYVLAAEWTPTGEHLVTAETTEAADAYLDLVPAAQTVNQLSPCLSRSDGNIDLPRRFYCLPLVLGMRPVARLILAVPWSLRLPQDQIDVLNTLALDLALTVDRLEQATRPSAGTVELQRTMARYLHDTLGHELAYLRMKLEVLSYDPHLQGQAGLRTEVERLHDVANRSYEQVRTVLADLENSDSPDLTLAVNECATCIAERSQVDFKLTSSGEPQALPGPVQRKALLALREVLHNIEKHAYAKTVWLNFSWNADHLMVTVADDGQGFDPAAAAALKDHYGLKIIQESIAEIGGRYSLESIPFGGTCFTLALPYHQF